MSRLKISRCRYFSVAVQAHDPGTFDPAAARRGTPVTVAGVPGWLTKLPAPDPRSRIQPTIELTWADPSGVWLVARAETFHLIEEEDLLRDVAGAIRVGAARPLAGPFQLGRVPDGLAVTSVSADYAERGAMLDTKVEFGGPEARPTGWGSGPPWPTLEISARVRDELYRPTRESNGFTEDAPIAGNRAYWSPWGREEDGDGGVLWVDTDRCVFRLDTLDKDRYPQSALRLIAADLTLGDCTRPATWKPFLGR